MTENINESEKEQKLLSSKEEKKIDSENNIQKNEENSEMKEQNSPKEINSNINNNEIIIKKEENEINNNENINKVEEELNIKNEENNKDNNNDLEKKENNINNNDINKKGGSGLMLTELLNINEKKEENPKNAYLKEKYPEINESSNLQKAIKLELKKSHEDLKKRILEDNLSLNINKSPYNKQLNLFINNKKSGKTSKLLKILKENEKSLSFNIGKLTSKQKIVESLSIPKDDKVGFNNREYNLKKIKNSKENLMKKLENINEQIKEIIIKESNMENKEKIIPDYRVLDENQEEYNKHLAEISKKSNDSSMKYRNKMKSSYDKRKNEIDIKEKLLLEEKQKNFREKIFNEKKLIAQRKKKNDEITNNINKYVHSKPINPENYIYNKLKEQYEEKQKKIIEKIQLMKKEPVMRKNDFDELAKRRNEQKKLMQMDNEERKKKLIELWQYRSETLPSYHHPLIKYIEEEEKSKRKEWNELEKKRIECNDLEKRNFKPPKVTINKVLRKQIENRKKVMNRDTIIKMRNNNRNIRFKFSPIKPISKRLIEHQLSFDKHNNNNNNISLRNNKKILKPIKILSPKDRKPKDYLKEVISKVHKGKSPNSTSEINFTNILEHSKNNIVESLMTARNQIEKIDDKLKRKKELLNMKDSYTNDVNLVDQVGKLLIDSVQSKINIISKICDK